MKKIILSIILGAALMGCGGNGCCDDYVPDSLASVDLAAGDDVLYPPVASMEMHIATPEEVEEARQNGTLYIVGDGAVVQAEPPEDSNGTDYTESYTVSSCVK